MQKQLGWLGVLGVFAALVLPTPAIEAQNPDYVLFVEDQAVPAEGSFPVEILLDNSQGEAAYAWTFGVCHDPAALSVTSADLSDRVEDLLLYDPFLVSIEYFADGFNVGVVLNGPFFLQMIPPSVGPLVVGNYSHTLSPGESTSVTVCETLDQFNLPIYLDIGSTTNGNPSVLPGTLTVLPAHAWIRGDANDDGTVDLADGVFVMNELFLDGPIGSCFDAKDANSDGAFELTDAIFILNGLFLGAPPPAAPYPDCGFVLGDCVFQASCP